MRWRNAIWNLRRLMCRHDWVKTRFQFQALTNTTPTTTYRCAKCDQISVVDQGQSPKGRRS